jgi:outer membrane protein OmpA-like peptidoglycan-associated protein
LLLALLIPVVVWAQPSEGNGEARPTVVANFKGPNGMGGPGEMPAPLRRLLEFGDGDGLLIDENLVQEVYPLLPIVFFDSGSTEIPKRYLRFADSTKILEFADTTISGGTLPKYYRILDIIGFRMRQFPKARLTITGCNSSEPGSIETGQCSMARAFAVGNYLANVWGIDKPRMTLVAQDLSRTPSSSSIPEGRIENRRVEITSTDPRITGVVCQRDLRRYPSPDTLHLDVGAGVPLSQVASSRIEITRGGEHWATINDVIERKGATFNWGRDVDPDSLPTDSVPYVIELTVTTHDGEKLRSDPLTIPVWIITPIKKRRVVEYRIDRFSISMFRVNDAKLDSVARREFAEWILPAIQPHSEISITGYADHTETNGMVLSEQRATEYAKLIKASKKLDTGTLESKGVGATRPIYDESTPEGRFYCRTVQVSIRSRNLEFVEWRTLH